MIRRALRNAGIGFAVLITLLLIPTRSLGQESKPSASPENSASVPNTSGTQTTGSRLGLGDVVEISVYNVPELTTKSRINANGEIHLPLINYIHVAGLTNEEAEKLIQKRLSDEGFVKDPQVTLLIDQAISQNVSIVGEVMKPGVYAFVPGQRLFDVLSAAGGLTEKAGKSATITHRDQPNAFTSISISRNLTDDPQSNMAVLAGDTIVVRKADVIYVVGDVGKPSGFLMESGGLTVLQAIALAGGTTRTAKLGGVRILRKGASGIEETPVQLKKILEAKAPDLPMQADDILFVPTSAAKGFAGHTVAAAIQAASAASIIAVMP